MRGGLGDRLPYQLKLKKSWSWRRELNPRPSDYKSDALPTELRQPACLILTCDIVELIPQMAATFCRRKAFAQSRKKSGQSEARPLSLCSAARKKDPASARLQSL